MLPVNWSVVFVLPSVLSLTPKNNNESVFVCVTQFSFTYIHAHTEVELKCSSCRKSFRKAFFCETCDIRDSYLSLKKKTQNQNKSNFQTAVCIEFILAA